jgi:hypothetical protein
MEKAGEFYGKRLTGQYSEVTIMCQELFSGSVDVVLGACRRRAGSETGMRQEMVIDSFTWF